MDGAVMDGSHQGVFLMGVSRVHAMSAQEMGAKALGAELGLLPLRAGRADGGDADPAPGGRRCCYMGSRWAPRKDREGEGRRTRGTCCGEAPCLLSGRNDRTAARQAQTSARAQPVGPAAAQRGLSDITQSPGREHGVPGRPSGGAAVSAREITPGTRTLQAVVSPLVQPRAETPHSHA